MNSDDNLINQILQSPQLRQTIQNAIQQSSSSQIPNNSIAVTNPGSASTSVGVREELRRLFPSRRPCPSSEASFSKKRKYKSTKKQVFTCDIILLKDSFQKKTLIGKRKAKAFEEGYAISSVSFEKSMSHDEVRNKLKSCFELKLMENPFDIMIPVGGYLVKPSLSEDQELDGLHLHKLFQHKTVYLRPQQDTLLREVCEEGNYCFVAEIEDTDSADRNNNDVEISEKEDIAIIESSTNHSLNNNDCLPEVTDEITSLDDILSKLRQQINEDELSLFNVYREDIFQCCVRALNRKSFSPYHKLSVCFVDSEDTTEGAIDAGGPTREMFRVVLQHIKNSRIFAGPDDKKYLVLNKDALEKQEYLNAGKLLVLSITHAGISPSFFSDLLFQQVTESATDYLYVNPRDLINDEDMMKTRLRK